MRAAAGLGRVPAGGPSVRATRTAAWVLAVALAAGCVATWRPWLEHWWPGRSEASALPHACDIADRATVERLP